MCKIRKDLHAFRIFKSIFVKNLHRYFCSIPTTFNLFVSSRKIFLPPYEIFHNVYVTKNIKYINPNSGLNDHRTQIIQKSQIKSQINQRNDENVWNLLKLMKKLCRWKLTLDLGHNELLGWVYIREDNSFP